MCYKKPGPRCDTDVLIRILDRSGFQRGSLDYKNLDMRCELLVTRGGLTALAQQIQECVNPEERNYLLAAYKTGYTNFIHRTSLIGCKPLPIHGHPTALAEVSPETDLVRLNNVSYGLYGYKNSPLYEKARQIESRRNRKITGYVPGKPKTTVMDTYLLSQSMNANLSGVPDNVVAIDIETDTSRGHGLQPYKAQITEMVICDRHITIVLAGDEKYILQGFADYMNGRSEEVEVIGWGNTGFDNPFLQIRGKYHSANLKEWGMHLDDLGFVEGYGPVGGYQNNQSMRWVTPRGVIHHDRDIMIEVKNSPVDVDSGSTHPRLKGLTRHWGMSPIELDRTKMHTYSEEERGAYVASDGIATLFAYAEYRRRALARTQPSLW